MRFDVPDVPDVPFWEGTPLKNNIFYFLAPIGSEIGTSGTSVHPKPYFLSIYSYLLVIWVYVMYPDVVPYCFRRFFRVPFSAVADVV